MPSSLISATVPKTVTSAVSFTITVDYQSTTGGTLSLGLDDGFSVAPASYDLSASTPGSATFSVTITRDTAKNAGTALELTFGNVITALINKVQ